MGLLRVKGTIKLAQFWPEGRSDADTTKIIVKVEHDAFEFQPYPGAPFTPTEVFNDAIVVGKGRKPAIDKQGRITVRLQGIDAPELHYRPSSPGGMNLNDAEKSRFKEWNEEYRQYFGETASCELHSLLKKVGEAYIPCKTITAVDKPGDVFDVYGRFIGDILVSINGKELNINQWLVKEGWAFPTFYNTMSGEEINAFLNAAKEGRKNKKRNRIWQNLQTKIGKLDEKLTYRAGKDVTPDPAGDRGPLIMPKLFRRLCTWTVYKKSGIVNLSFRNYLAKNPDRCFLTEEFLEKGVHASTPYVLHEPKFLKSNNQFTKGPQDFVFFEKYSKLIGPDKKEITDW